MREFEIKPKLGKELVKLFKKDKARYEAAMSKIQEIIDSGDIEHYKNLRYDMKDSKRVQIGHFVLVFSYDKAKDFVSFEDYDHHDNIYQK
ncbi:addiction module toxin RelE [Candidatus Woesearchaeota archaeon CG10_big_fil_rev_8_21_14_0_10_44_13]|nr:MAG: addiction module toxin RelE [Candidatus Woesearchaeota archaeon CG10_big_fil_rev_8_21_14_0_10_44_13]